MRRHRRATAFLPCYQQRRLSRIAEAKKREKKSPVKLLPNHLTLTSEDVGRIGSMAIMAPPLRDKTHRDALRKGLEDGTVDTVGSDHAPHTLEEKLAGSVWEVKVGVVGLETTLPLMMTLVRQKKLSLNQVVRVLAEKPAEIFGLADRGRLEAGKNADLTIVDYNANTKSTPPNSSPKPSFPPTTAGKSTANPQKPSSMGNWFSTRAKSSLKAAWVQWCGEARREIRCRRHAGKLTRWLRMLGQDVIYSVQFNDNELLELAKAEARVLLTKDLELYRRAVGRGLDAFYVEGETESARLAEVAKRYGLALAVDMDKSHCPVCNAKLAAVPKEQLQGELEENTYKYYERFWRCPNCGQVYWQGAHWKQITATLTQAQQKNAGHLLMLIRTADKRLIYRGRGVAGKATLPFLCCLRICL